MTNRQKTQTSAPARQQYNLQAWLVEIDTGRLVAGPVPVQMSMANRFYCTEPLRVGHGELNVLVRFSVSDGESSIYEDPTAIRVTDGDQVRIGMGEMGPT